MNRLDTRFRYEFCPVMTRFARAPYEVWPVGLGGPTGDEVAGLVCQACSEGGMARLSAHVAAGVATPQQMAGASSP